MRVLLNVSRRVARGDALEVRLLISHPMESGQRRDDGGAPVPRQIIHSLRAAYGGAEVLALELHPAVAANPYFAFAFRPEASGALELAWEDDAGVRQVERVEIEVV